MRKFVERIFFLEDKQILKWGRFNAYINLILGAISLCSPVVIMTVVQRKATQLAHIRKLEADSLHGLDLFDSSREFYRISSHLYNDAYLFEGLPAIFSLLIFLTGCGLTSTGISQLKLQKLLKEKEEQK